MVVGPPEGPAQLDDAPRLLELVRSDFESGPGAISPHLYWWDGKVFRAPSAKNAEGKLEPAIPAGLRAPLGGRGK